MICEICGAEFDPPRGNSKYCSDPCRRKARSEREKERARRVRSERYVVHYEASCKQCGKPFVQTSVLQKYCSDDCRNKAAYQRKKTADPKPRQCPICGGIYLPTTRKQTVCSKTCSRIKNMMIYTPGMTYEEGLAKIAKLDAEKARKKKPRISELSRVAREAREHGMSYGQYVAMTEGAMSPHLRKTEALERAKLRNLERDLKNSGLHF